MRLAAIAFVLASLVGCKGKSCISMQKDVTPSSVRMQWSQCSDDHDHSIDCGMRGADFTCTCNPGTQFNISLIHGMMPEITPAQAREGCGWDFTP